MLGTPKNMGMGTLLPWLVNVCWYHPPKIWYSKRFGSTSIPYNPSGNLRLLHSRLIPFFSKMVCHLFSTFSPWCSLWRSSIFSRWWSLGSAHPPNDENMLLSWYPLSQGPEGLIQGWHVPPLMGSYFRAPSSQSTPSWTELLIAVVHLRVVVNPLLVVVILGVLSPFLYGFVWK